MESHHAMGSSVQQRLTLGFGTLKRHGLFRLGWVPEALVIQALIAAGALRESDRPPTRAVHAPSQKEFSSILNLKFKQADRDMQQLLREPRQVTVDSVRRMYIMWVDQNDETRDLPKSEIVDFRDSVKNAAVIWAAGSQRQLHASATLDAIRLEARVAAAAAASKEDLENDHGIGKTPSRPPAAKAKSSVKMGRRSKKPKFLRSRWTQAGDGEVLQTARKLGTTMPTSEMSTVECHKYLQRSARTLPEDMSQEEAAKQIRALRHALYRGRATQRHYRNSVRKRLADSKGSGQRAKVFDSARKLLSKSGRPDYVFDLARRLVDGTIDMEDTPAVVIWNIVRNSWRTGKEVHGCRYEEALLLMTASLARSRSAKQVTQVLSHEKNICLPDERTHERHTAKHRLGDVGTPGVHTESCSKYFAHLAQEHGARQVAGDASKLGHGDLLEPEKFAVGGFYRGGQLTSVCWRSSGGTQVRTTLRCAPAARRPSGCPAQRSHTTLRRLTSVNKPF
jgi:hypothetical protein